MIGFMFLMVLLVSPLILILAGLIMRASAVAETRNRGAKMAMYGVILFAVEVLIGYAVCSNLGWV